MKTKRTNRNCGGLTVIEMLVSTTLLAMIIIGLTAMFVQTQRAFKLGIRQSSTADAGRTVIDLVGTDLSQASDAGMPGVITNLFWSWDTNENTFQYQDALQTPFRTNELQQVFVLVHTNSQWVGIGYAVSNWAPGVGTLYRYAVSTNAPLLDNSLFMPFWTNAVLYTNFGDNFSRVADGVIHFKISAFDQYGNEMAYYEPEMYSSNSFFKFGYPVAAYTNYLNVNSNFVPAAALPSSIQLEVGVLEPETFDQLRALPARSTAQTNFLRRAGGHIHIFRQNIPVAAAAR